MRLRIKFTKLDPLSYIGHLDLMRYFQKVLRRANIPVKYSEGFNPHIEMSFALPLGVGTYSIGDYLDVDLDNDDVKWLEKQYNNPYNEDKMSLDLLQDIYKNIAKESVDEIVIRGINIVPSNKKNKVMSLVSYSDYLVSIPYNSTDIFERDHFITLIENYLNNKIILTKSTKNGIKEIDFTKSLIEYRLAKVSKLKDKNYSYFEFLDNESSHKIIKDNFVNNIIDEYYENYIASAEVGNLIIFIRTKSGSVDNLNPRLLFDNFLTNEQLYHVYRLEMYDDSLKRLLDSVII